MAEFISKVGSIFSTYDFVSDTLDILFIALILYLAIKFIRDTRALLLAKGIFLLAVVYLVVYLLNMQASTYIFGKVFSNILVILFIIFTPEIRTALEKMGGSSISSVGIFKNRASAQIAIENKKINATVNAVCKACAEMSDKKIGALIVFENRSPLGEIINTGTVIDAAVSPEIIGNIFYPKSPLHDGGAIIRDCRLYAAGCILPLTKNHEISSSLGTRHRAAIGMSENSDAIVLVVSEETGYISLAEGGKLDVNVSDGTVRERLLEKFTVEIIDKESKHEKKASKSKNKHNKSETLKGEEKDNNEKQ